MNSYNKINTIGAIVGVPRSGTSWVGQIFNSSPHVTYRYQPLFSYEFKNKIDKNSSATEIEDFHSNLLDAQSDFVLQRKNVTGNKGIIFDKKNITTLIWKEVRYLYLLDNLLSKSEIKIILIVRHPAAVINSWIKAPKEFDKSWVPEQEWKKAFKKNRGLRENYYGYEKWKEAMELFLKLQKKYQKQVLLSRYEDLVQNPEDNTKKMFTFIGLSLERQTEDFLKASQSVDDADSYGVYRKNPDINQWKGQLPSSIKELLLLDFYESALSKKLGYKNE